MGTRVLPQRTAVIVVHGAGSSAVAARRLVPPALFRHACTTYVTDPDSRLDRLLYALDDWYLSRQRADQRFVAGISLGAHAVASWLVENPGGADAAILIMPAWTGPPDHAASLTAAAASLMRIHGVDNELRRLRRTASSHRSWIVEALQVTWASQPQERVIAGMERAAQLPAPSLDDLSSIAVPTLVIGLRNDPLHPLATAHAWADALVKGRCIDVVDAEVAEIGHFATPRITREWLSVLDEITRVHPQGPDHTDNRVV